jgi:hypothetical protein
MHQEILNYLSGCPDISIFEFLGACDPWKMEWTKRCRETGRIRIYPATLKGWARYAIEAGWKDLLKKSPPVMRIASTTAALRPQARS